MSFAVTAVIKNSICVVL